MIMVDRISKEYGQKQAVNEVSFTVEPGTVTGLIGPNGAGKSTTLRILLGLTRPTSGEATGKGRRNREIPFQLFNVGALLGHSMPAHERRAVDHLMWIAHSNGIPRKRVMEVLSEVGLEENDRTRVKKYSLGMKQRLGIAVVLLGKPEVIVLDEPMNGLDPEGIHWIRSFM